MNDSAQHPGFKQTTIENWLEPDPLMAIMVKRDHRDGSVYPVNGTDWIKFVNSLVIADSVPGEVREAFAFASGAIGYAYFYYPMFTIVSQQVLRVADFATDKLAEIRGIGKIRSFAHRLALLSKGGLLSEVQDREWCRIRKLRNSATHPAWQQNWGLAMSLELIRDVARAISELPWPPAPDAGRAIKENVI